MGNVKSGWLKSTKGCPQGSLFGPLTYNIFSNDLLLLLQDVCHVYNYADDNSVGTEGKNQNEIVSKLANVSRIMLKWFDDNYLQANPEKFKFIIFSNSPQCCTLSLNQAVHLNSLNEVKLLGSP